MLLTRMSILPAFLATRSNAAVNLHPVGRASRGQSRNKGIMWVPHAAKRGIPVTLNEEILQRGLASLNEEILAVDEVLARLRAH